MAYQNISHTLPADVMNQLRSNLQQINASLPFLVTLSPDEIRGLVKLGPKSADFVQDAYGAAMAFPQILPQSFDPQEFGRDTTLFAQLAEVKLLLDSLTEKVNNTYFAVGSESMQSALEIYAYVQTAKDRVPGLKSVADKLKERFKNQGRSKKKDDNGQSEQ